MIEPVEKKKKKRRRSARVYISNAHPLPTPEQLAALVDQFPSDEDDDQPTPAHTEARARTRAMAKPDTGKRDAGQPGLSAADARVSPSRVIGQAAASTGDHGAAVASDPMCQPGPRELAWRHPDLRQQSVSFNDVIARLQTVNGDGHGDRDITYTAGEVGLNLFSARAAAGSYSGMNPVGHSPQRPAPHQSRGSATPPNGSHGLANPVSTPPQAMKNTELQAEFRRLLFPGSGGGR